MSEPTVRTPASQSQSLATSPETQAAEHAAVQEASAAAAEKAAAEEAQARADADAVLKQAARAYARGEKAYRAGLLEAGRLADDYLHRRMALGDKRAAAVELATLELSRYASSTVDVNELVGCHHAYTLLGQQGYVGP